MNSPLLFLGDIGGSEMILIVVVILIFFGANKIPELARGLGKGIREFKDASSEIRNEFERSAQQPSYSQHQPPQAPAQPYAPQPDYSQPPAPYQPDAAMGSSYPAAPDYTAPATVISPPAAPVAHHDTPIPPTTDGSGIPGTQPRRSSTSTDV